MRYSFVVRSTFRPFSFHSLYFISAYRSLLQRTGDSRNWGWIFFWGWTNTRNCSREVSKHFKSEIFWLFWEETAYARMRMNTSQSKSCVSSQVGILVLAQTLLKSCGRGKLCLAEGLTVVRSPHLEKLGPQNKKLQVVLLGVCKTSRSSSRCLQDWQYIHSY